MGKEYSFQPRWRCCWDGFWREQAGLRTLPRCAPATDLAADVADQPAEPGTQDAQLPTVAVKLFGVGIAPRHHRRVLWRYGCRTAAAVLLLLVMRLSPWIAACSSLASVGKLMALGCTVVSTVTRARSRVRSAPLACATRRLSANSSSSSLSPRRFLHG